jgi:response regulator RpfG family c-di-GMP phosphodiesterase
MNEAILFVDDNRLILEQSKNCFLSRGIEILTASDAQEALQHFRTSEIAVVVSDNYMPGMTGLEFLSTLKIVSPDTVKILMSAYADLSMALAAINRSEVFRYVVKPWKEEDLINAVQEGMKRYRVVQSLRREDEDILRSLAQTIELKDPSTKGHCDRVAVYALLIAEAMQLPKEIQRQIKYGSWLHDCGKIGVSEFILNGNRQLTTDEFETMKMHSYWGADVAAKANLSEIARNIIHYHHERYDGSGYPSGLIGTDIPLEARIVAVADVYDALSMDRPYRNGYPFQKTLEIIVSMKGKSLDPDIVDTFLPLLNKDNATLTNARQRFAMPVPLA